MTLDEALAYDAGPSGDLACEHWCDGLGAGGTGRCNCGMERARAVVTALQAAVINPATAIEPPVGSIIEQPNGALWIHEPPDGEDMRPSGYGGNAHRDRSWFRLDLANDDPETWVKIGARVAMIRRGGKTFAHLEESR